MVGFAPFYVLALILPNLRELDLSYLQTDYPDRAVGAFCNGCPHLTRLTWNDNCVKLLLGGDDFRDAANLTELNLDACRFYHSRRPVYWETESLYRGRNYYMFRNCQRLERLSIKDSSRCRHSHETFHKISQAMIIKFVRYTPTLRWLKSDLTDENVTMLQQERPDVTFVTD
jgi:hypothetical protein